MKCTLKIFWSILIKFLPWGLGSSAVPCHLTRDLFQAFPDKKYVKKSILREI